MIVGVDSIHVKKKGTGLDMVTTINGSFTDFYNKEEIIKEKDNKKEGLQYCVSSFIDELIEAYKKKNKNEKPKGIVTEF